MEGTVLLKFNQNPELKRKLIATGDAVLVEENYWGDKFWGVCSKTGEGENHLGIILMKTREDLGGAKYEAQKHTPSIEFSFQFWILIEFEEHSSFHEY